MHLAASSKSYSGAQASKVTAAVQILRMALVNPVWHKTACRRPKQADNYGSEEKGAWCGTSLPHQLQLNNTRNHTHAITYMHTHTTHGRLTTTALRRRAPGAARRCLAATRAPRCCPPATLRAPGAAPVAGTCLLVSLFPSAGLDRAAMPCGCASASAAQSADSNL